MGYRKYRLGSYDEMRAQHRWEVPARYNIAADVCDKHPADKSPEGNDQTPGDYPIAWCKEYGKGRVFYTSLGHREDVWDPNTPESFKRENPKEVSEAYQKHLLGGIKWALGLEKGDAKPQTKLGL